MLVNCTLRNEGVTERGQSRDHELTEGVFRQTVELEVRQVLFVTLFTVLFVAPVTVVSRSGLHLSTYVGTTRARATRPPKMSCPPRTYRASLT